MISTLPECTPSKRVLESHLVRLSGEGQLVKLVLTPVAPEPDAAVFVAAYFTADPRAPFYWVEALDDDQPKVFSDRDQLLRSLMKDFEGIPVQVRLRPNA